MLVLVLPGAALDDLVSPHLTMIPRAVKSSSGAWVSVWRPGGALSDLCERVPAPTRHAVTRPYGVMADYPAILAAARLALRAGRPVWVDPGDTERAARYAPLCLPVKAAEHRRVALEQADRLLSDLMRTGGLRDVWLLSPALDSRSGLTPFFWLRRGFGPGLLWSGSTRITGVVTGPDLVATLAGLSGRPYQGDGRRLEVAPLTGSSSSTGPGPELQRLAQLITQTEMVRARANPWIKSLLLALALLSIAALRMRRRLPVPIALVPLFLPALLLLEAAFRSDQEAWGLVLSVLLLVSVAWVALVRRRYHAERSGEAGRDPCIWRIAAAATATACGVALLWGGLFRWAVAGYSIPLGVRFYGIGNEFMGWWVGAALLAACPRRRKASLGSVGLLVVLAVLIGHPSLGANLGGGITAIGAALVAAWPAVQGRRALAVGAMVGALGVFIGLVLWDAARPIDLQTHLGRMASRVWQDGLGPLAAMAAGKVATNLRISLGFWGVLLAAGDWLAMEARRRTPDARGTGAHGLLLPSAALAFVTNDSGVIAAALMLSYGVIAASNVPDRTAFRHKRDRDSPAVSSLEE
jgi:hypothetical protein